MAVVAGIKHCKIDGVQYPVRDTANISLSDKQFETLAFSDGVHGFKQMGVAPFIECQFTKLKGHDLNRIQEMQNVTVVVELYDGQSAILPQATQVSVVELNAAEGEYTVRFEGAVKGEWA